MLKPTDPGSIPPQGERPIGELVHELVDEGKGYVRAELEVAKAVAVAKGKKLILPAGLFGAAVVFVQAAIMALAIGLFFELYRAMDPILAGLIAFVISGTIAGALGWYAVQRIKRDL